MTGVNKILAFGASNSSTSINHRLALWAAQQLSNVEIVELMISTYKLPIFGVDLEKEIGHHKEGQRFLDEIAKVDGIVISLAEHNGSYTVAFKNLLDWASRIEGKVWQGKPILALSTSPGKRGGASVLSSFLSRMPYMGGNIISHFSLPNFQHNFIKGSGLVNTELNMQFQSELQLFSNSYK